MEKFLLKQISGTKLQFRPSSSMGFTTNDNWIICVVRNYTPGNTQVDLSFVSVSKPEKEGWGEFTTTFIMTDIDIDITDEESVNEAIKNKAIVRTIEHLKSFNIGCDFEKDNF